MNNVLKSTTSMLCTTLGAVENLSHGLNGVSLAARYEGESFARMTKKNCVAKETRRSFEIDSEMAAIKQLIHDSPIPTKPIKMPKKVKAAGTG
jgi:hypothetical protein